MQYRSIQSISAKNQQKDRPVLVLASGSRYRADMLKRLGLPFEVKPANIDETPKNTERGQSLALRLSMEKARRVSLEHPDALIIGADQVAVVQDTTGSAESSASREELLLGKPGNQEQAASQLQAMRGRTVLYYSGLAMIGTGIEHNDVVPTRLQMRNYSDAEIQRYLEQDQPWDCAGSMRSESLGISLVSELNSNDPTALIGMPLILLSHWLRRSGFNIP